jgi:hypothetical protein
MSTACIVGLGSSWIPSPLRRAGPRPALSGAGVRVAVRLPHRGGGSAAEASGHGLGAPAPRLEVSASAPTATPEEAAEASIEAAGSEYSDVGIRHRLERNGARNAGFLARVSARALKVP